MQVGICVGDTARHFARSESVREARWQSQLDIFLTWILFDRTFFGSRVAL